jgi:hypothetical protein
MSAIKLAQRLWSLEKWLSCLQIAIQGIGFKHPLALQIDEIATRRLPCQSQRRKCLVVENGDRRRNAGRQSVHLNGRQCDWDG